MATSPETLLISAVLRTKTMDVAVAERITPDLFVAYSDEWEWLYRYYNRHKRTPSAAAFRNEFPSFVMYKIDDTELYCDKVRERYAKRSLTHGMNEAAKLLATGDIDKAMLLIKETVVQTAAKADNSHDTDILSDYESILRDTEDTLQRVKELGSAGVPTSFDTWDAYTGGCKPGELIVVAARLGVGKSWVLMQAANAAVNAGYRVQYDALEMTRTQVAGRMHDLMAGGKGYSGFKSLDLILGKPFNISEYRKFLHDTKVNAKSGLYVSDRNTGRLTPMMIEAQIEKNKPDIVFIDYLQLMDADAQGDWAAIGKITAQLKAIATQYQIPIVAAAQINREGTGKEPPPLDSIAQSDRIAQDADQVVTLSQWAPSVVAACLRKNRHGESSPLWFNVFDPGNGILREVSRKEAEQLAERDMDLADQLKAEARQAGRA